MDEQTPGRTIPSATRLAAATLVALGVLLWMSGYQHLLFVAGLGAFGPGILRELGLLNDHDEFERQAAHRAGYHAYLGGGFATVLLLSVLAIEGTSLVPSIEWLRVLLIVMWSTWMFSALIAYWGPQTTASRVLLTFGSFWALFVIASLVGGSDTTEVTGDIWSGVVGTLVGIGLLLPFFLLAWTAGRWPRQTGAVLLLVSVIFSWVFGGRGGGNLAWSTKVLTLILLVGPLLSSGIALVRLERTPAAT